jgi:hypothetical protein
VCCFDFKISHGGFDDVERHVSSSAHKSKAAACDKTSKISSFFGTAQSGQTTEQDLQIIRAETLFARFLVEHNVCITAADHARELFLKMFPGNAVALTFCVFS